MPFRFADSEKPATIFPVAGQIQPRLSSSISGTRPDSALDGEAGIVAGAAAIARASGAGVPGDAVTDDCCCNCASACSEYGSLIALGSVLKVGELARPLADDGTTGGRTSPALGVTGAVVISGAVVTPAWPPGGLSSSTWPTRMTLTFSMLFHAASSRESTPLSS